jgi:hypothetical protein
LKRWSLVAVVALIALALLRLGWGYEAQRRVDAFVSATHARGERARPDDFVAGAPPPPLEAENAAVPLAAAAAGIVYTPAQQTWEANWSQALPLSPTDRAMLQAIASQNRASLRLARQATSRPAVDWQLPTGARPAPGPMFNPQRGLATLIRYVALYEHDAGNDAEAVELMLDLERQASAVGRISPTLVSVLVAYGIDSFATETAITLAPTFDVATTQQPAATTRPASPPQVRRLIARLLDESGLREMSDQAWQGEASLALQQSSAFGRSMEPAVLEPLVRPTYTIDGVRAAREARRFAVAGHSNLPAAMAVVSREPPDPGKSHLHQTATVLSDQMRGVSRLAEVHFRILCDRRAAAIMLAIRCYQLDHAGALPPTLETLFPTYLPHWPTDPMRKDGSGFRYLPSAKTPCIYSVGTDGVDDGGSSTPGSYTWDTPNRDAVYPLVPMAPAPAATQPGS